MATEGICAFKNITDKLERQIWLKNKKESNRSWEVLISGFYVFSWRQWHLQRLSTQRQPHMTKDEASVREGNSQEKEKDSLRSCYYDTRIQSKDRAFSLDSHQYATKETIRIRVFFLLFNSCWLCFPVLFFLKISLAKKVAGSIYLHRNGGKKRDVFCLDRILKCLLKSFQAFPVNPELFWDHHCLRVCVLPLSWATVAPTERPLGNR